MVGIRVFKERKSMTKPVYRLAAITLIALLPLLASCNTVRGVGKDISAVGHGISNTSGKN